MKLNQPPVATVAGFFMAFIVLLAGAAISTATANYSTAVFLGLLTIPMGTLTVITIVLRLGFRE